MIFAIADHVQQIVDGSKTQTRRASGRYQVGKTYAIQPCRTCKAIPDGRIKVIQKRRELPFFPITKRNAQAEGGYTPIEFELLYAKMHPNWKERWAYTFGFVSMKREGDANTK